LADSFLLGQVGWVATWADGPGQTVSSMPLWPSATGGQGVVGSNPAVPTTFLQVSGVIIIDTSKDVKIVCCMHDPC